MSQASPPVFFVSRLPWCREGVLTRSRAQVNLVAAVGRVLDTLENDPSRASWILAGQSALLEDYLAAVPGDRPRITRLIRNGALAVGPWYLLPDEFLVSGEATVRNLLWGHLTTGTFGKRPLTGYLSDGFGHVAQLPQILDLMGLDTFIFTRGLPAAAGSPGSSFGWTAPNGSGVLAIRADIASDHGLDQARRGFADAVSAARRHTPDAGRPRLAGELLGAGDPFIHGGGWSARMYLKQANEACQTLLCRYVEPLLAAAHYRHDDRWPTGLLDHAWRELLRNQARDSLGGCGTDSVHKDMDTRFAVVQQTAEQLLGQLMGRIAPTGDGTTVLAVANPLPFPRDEVVERLVVLPPSDRDLDNLRLLDEDGRQIPFRVSDRLFVENLPGVDYAAELFCDDQWNLLHTYLDRFGDRVLGTGADQGTHNCFLTIQFLARDLPAVGHRHYFLTDDQASAKPSPPFSPVSARRLEDAVVLENKLLKVALHPDGTFDLENRISGRRYDGLNLLEDTEDIGDEFDYSHAPVGGTFFSGGLEGKVRLVEQSDLLCRAQASFKFLIPRSLEKDRHQRNQRNARCDVRVTLTLRTGSPLVEVETDFNNHAFDHRLRAWFPTGLPADEVVSDGQFMLNHRPLVRPKNGDETQPTPPTWPQQDFSLIQGLEEGLAVFNRGLPEFQTWAGPDGGAIYALTLLRCVDWLSRDDFPTRGHTNAGPMLYTPDAQCYGQHTFRYAVTPCGPDPFAADIKGLSERYRVPPVTHQGGGGDRLRPGGASFIAKTNPRVVITALKKAQIDDRLIVRLYNLDSAPTTEHLLCGLPVLEACQVDLREENMVVDCAEPAIGREGLRVDITLEPFQIITLALTFDLES